MDSTLDKLFIKYPWLADTNIQDIFEWHKTIIGNKLIHYKRIKFTYSYDLKSGF